MKKVFINKLRIIGNFLKDRNLYEYGLLNGLINYYPDPFAIFWVIYISFPH
ncbi:MAG: hypothetical protein H5U37_04670 [Caldisericia bacterium]|nr:hypothetical protein [Caldisericia bacterium]